MDEKNELSGTITAEHATLQMPLCSHKIADHCEEMIIQDTRLSNINVIKHLHYILETCVSVSQLFSVYF